MVKSYNAYNGENHCTDLHLVGVHGLICQKILFLHKYFPLFLLCGGDIICFMIVSVIKASNISLSYGPKKN